MQVMKMENKNPRILSGVVVTIKLIKLSPLKWKEKLNILYMER